jgi:hypothetical protein
MSSLALALDARTLLYERHHHINNEFTSSINLVAVDAVRTDNRDVRGWANLRVRAIWQLTPQKINYTV